MNLPRITFASIIVALMLAACQNTPTTGAAASGGSNAATPAAAPTAESNAPQAADAPAAAPETPATPAATSTMTVEEMQKRLSELGYQPGPADGKAGPRTVGALKKFQHDHNLPTTGKLDPETIARLEQGK